MRRAFPKPRIYQSGRYLVVRHPDGTTGRFTPHFEQAFLRWAGQIHAIRSITGGLIAPRSR